VRALGVSGQMHGLVALDGHEAVIRPAILWNDQRTHPQCRAIIEQCGGLDALLQLTNNGMLAGYTAPKLLWLREHEPEAFARIEHVLLPKDYNRFKFTGELATDVSDASGTGVFDVARRRWSTETPQTARAPANLVSTHIRVDGCGRTFATRREFSKGVLICGTGLGTAITANKLKGVYAGACEGIFAAERLAKSNNAQIITLGARVTGPETARIIVNAFIETEFQGGRALPKVTRIQDIENEIFN
jgi:hypothetical protein